MRNNEGSVPVNLHPGLPFRARDVTDGYSYLPGDPDIITGVRHKVKVAMWPNQSPHSGWLSYNSPDLFPIKDTPLIIPQVAMITIAPLNGILTHWSGNYGSTNGWTEIRTTRVERLFIVNAFPRDGTELPNGTYVGSTITNSFVDRYNSPPHPFPYPLPAPYVIIAGAHQTFIDDVLYTLNYERTYTPAISTVKAPVQDDPSTTPSWILNFGKLDIDIDETLIKTTIENARPGITYVNNVGRTTYIRTFNTENKIFTKDLDAPTFLGPEVVPSNFLHIHIGICPRCNTSSVANKLNSSERALQEVAIVNGLFQVQRAAAIFPRYGIRGYGFGDVTTPPTHSGSASGFPPAYNNEEPRYWRETLKSNMLRADALPDVNAAYMGEDPTTQDIIDLIADYFGFTV